MFKNKSLVKEKVLAEQLNGPLAMNGLIVKVCSFLKTGQINFGMV